MPQAMCHSRIDVKMSTMFTLGSDFTLHKRECKTTTESQKQKCHHDVYSVYNLYVFSNQVIMYLYAISAE